MSSAPRIYAKLAFGVPRLWADPEGKVEPAWPLDTSHIERTRAALILVHLHALNRSEFRLDEETASVLIAHPWWAHQPQLRTKGRDGDPKGSLGTLARKAVRALVALDLGREVPAPRHAKGTASFVLVAPVRAVVHLAPELDDAFKKARDSARGSAVPAASSGEALPVDDTRTQSSRAILSPRDEHHRLAIKDPPEIELGSLNPELRARLGDALEHLRAAYADRRSPSSERQHAALSRIYRAIEALSGKIPVGVYAGRTATIRRFALIDHVVRHVHEARPAPIATAALLAICIEIAMQERYDLWFKTSLEMLRRANAVADLIPLDREPFAARMRRRSWYVLIASSALASKIDELHECLSSDPARLFLESFRRGKPEGLGYDHLVERDADAEFELQMAIYEAAMGNMNSAYSRLERAIRICADPGIDPSRPHAEVVEMTCAQVFVGARRQQCLDALAARTNLFYADAPFEAAMLNACREDLQADYRTIVKRVGRTQTA